MDTATEKSVIERLKAWAGQVMVTHRNTLLGLADRVLVMDQGAIVPIRPLISLKRQDDRWNGMPDIDFKTRFT